MAPPTIPVLALARCLEASSVDVDASSITAAETLHKELRDRGWSLMPTDFIETAVDGFGAMWNLVCLAEGRPASTSRDRTVRIPVPMSARAAQLQVASLLEKVLAGLEEMA